MPSYDTPTVKAFAATFLQDKQNGGAAPYTIATYDGVIRRHILPTLGGMHLSQLDQKTIAGWYHSIPASQSRRSAYVILGGMMRHAQEYGLIDSWSVKITNGTKSLSPDRPGFSVDDFWSVHAKLSPIYQDAITFMAGAALRIGELCGLNASDWDAKAGVLKVHRQYSLGKLRDTKTKKFAEVHPLAFSRDALNRAVTSDDGRVEFVPMFVGAKGFRIVPQNVRDAWIGARTKANLPNFRVHDIRHLSISAYARSNVSPKEIQAFGRHDDPTSSARYQHLGTAERLEQKAAEASKEFERPNDGNDAGMAVAS